MTSSFPNRLRDWGARLRGAWLVLSGQVWAAEPGTPNANDTPGERMVNRLTPHMLTHLEKQLACPPLLGNSPNDPLYAGQVIGVQRVLKLLRDGWTVNR